MLRENSSGDGETARPACPADSDHAPPDSEIEPRPTTDERSTDQPAGPGLKATGGFLKRLSGTGDGATRSEYDSKRAQTSIDFAVGASVFLLTVAFVVAFLPGAFDPFTASGEGEVQAADRTASLLAEQVLADPTDPGVLNATCTAEFFSETDDGTRDACGLDADAADLDAALGLGPTTSVNVTVEENGTVRSVLGEPLAAGPTPPTTEGVVVSRRVVLLDGEERDLYVRVW